MPEWIDRYQDVPHDINVLARKAIGVAIDVHKDLGPGLLEKPYQLLLAQRLANSGHHCRIEAEIPLVMDGLHFEVAYRADLVVDDLLLLEIKTAEDIDMRHIYQVKTYLRIGGFPLGLLLNFGAPILESKRIVP